MIKLRTLVGARCKCGETSGTVPFSNNLAIGSSPARLGKGTDPFLDLKVGDSIAFAGPIGYPFTMPASRKADITMIGTGTGIAPFRPVFDAPVELDKVIAQKAAEVWEMLQQPDTHLYMTGSVARW